ncbi:2-(3-amino-3-carboxypropyl)histidine synthase subunit 2-like [Saccoglossus kowalevskii]|uniref:2-(3-amino-3-carboxypropyl)histidine synthase subunit 2 n=1 Tax=Saccoglossus kowalevskii TaxID=10224 RepID=A0ABM0MII1_SACKO|nr:PREDICTED: diphthamide biosynthesis protein 2-like [Saccoglossus kowalevskii]
MSTSTAAFSSDWVGVIQRTVEVENSMKTADTELQDKYEICRCIEFIKSGKYQKVALQFPDHLLVDSVAIATELEKNTGAKLFVLGDTSYGSCCVDEIAAQHVNADCIIHFGRSCLSPTRRLPVLYVFGRQEVDIDHCSSVFNKLIEDTSTHLVVMYDVVYSHIISLLEAKLSHIYSNMVISKFKYENNSTEKDNYNGGTEPNLVTDDIQTFTISGRQVSLSPGKQIADYIILYIGGESLTLTNLMMSLNRCTFFTYDPQTRRGQQETLNINKALMRRYYLIEKAKDARVVGIVAGTLGVADYMNGISRVKQLVKKAGKKSYTFVMGKINIAKMANFMEVDVFVLISCPENSLIDSSEFYKPIVTPFEMEIACNQAREWTGDYVTDFRQLLPGGDNFIEMPSDDVSGNLETDVSLITGGIRRMGEEKDDIAVSSSAIVKRDDVLTVSTVHATSAEYLSSRSWQGLEQRLGETSVSQAIEGQKGIASGYANEKSSSKET